MGLPNLLHVYMPFISRVNRLLNFDKALTTSYLKAKMKGAFATIVTCVTCSWRGVQIG